MNLQLYLHPTVSTCGVPHRRGSLPSLPHQLTRLPASSRRGHPIPSRAALPLPPLRTFPQSAPLRDHAPQLITNTRIFATSHDTYVCIHEAKIHTNDALRIATFLTEQKRKLAANRGRASFHGDLQGTWASWGRSEQSVRIWM